MDGLMAFKFSAGGAARSMPTYDDGTTPTLVTEKPPAIVFKIRGGADTYVKHDGSIGTAGKGLLTSDELAFTVAATQDQTLCQHATSEYIVRRLTPEECERLQGMPTGHTRIPWKGKPAEECPDGPRYKAIGNSMAVPVMRWLGVRLEEVDRIMRESEDGTRG